MNDLLKGINIFLIGMMGAGKTTIGRLLAAELDYRFFDTDELIELVVEKTINQKKTIKQIFADDGEETFRDLETNVLSDLSAYTKSIVATGGGIVLRRMNWSYLHHGLVVWLDVPIEVLIERLQNDTARPLLQNPDPKSALQKLLDQRRSLYAEADLHIKVSASDTSEQIVARLIAEIPTVLKSARPGQSEGVRE